MRTGIKKFASRMIGANEYILFNNNEAIIVDPCVNPSKIKPFLKEMAIKPILILLTHGHFDHITYLDETRKAFGIEGAVHGEEANTVGDNTMNGALLFGSTKKINDCERLLSHNEKIVFGNTELRVIHTPGHSPGSCSFYCDDMLLTGDTLFYMSIGRTDLGMGNYEQIMDSINNRIMTLPEKTLVYPGHGTFTSIEFEKYNNPFIV